ncbi:hypothetical protein MUN82_07415 [Hymenobacter aerilatus]|uniref:Energy transducer TonB n=1 Tax=Hymenobacter aerilatus TaxID=2932251 RepID=A0A8T9SXH2_9BACT|nr:hypothetical protein [Hymenobacter aerilatus]UOR06922.1 hypothetical protein MUN82_07415 [Hymenobacter aerilatus]
MATHREEHRREALLGAVIIHGVLAVVLVFTVFKGPDPPLTFGGDGVELNYGIDEAGSGDIQSLATANDSRNREDSRPPANNPSPQPRAAPVTPPPSPPQPAVQEKIVTSEAEESPVSVPPVTRATPRPTSEPPREVVREEPPPKPAPKPRTLYTPRGSASGGGNGVNGTSNTPTGNNNGDRPGSVGDQGDPRGTLNAKALYGQPGSGGSGSSPGGGGSGLEMGGWGYVRTPSPPAVDNASGFVRFRIRVNADGEIESIVKVAGNVSAAQEKACRDALQNAEFRRTTAGSGGGTGFATFRITVQ